jgi:hypothetical protein
MRAVRSLAKSGGSLFDLAGKGAFLQEQYNVFLMKFGGQAEGLPSPNSRRHLLSLAQARATVFGDPSFCVGSLCYRCAAQDYEYFRQPHQPCVRHSSHRGQGGEGHER